MKRIIYYSILIFIFSCFIGFFYARLWKNNNANFATENITSDSNTVAETFSNEEKISFSANFALKKYYDECGHSEFNYSELPNELINLTKTELENLFPDWEVEEFSSNSVVLAKREECICNEHYVLKMNDEEVDVFHIDQDGEEKMYTATSITKDYLTSEDISNLKNGIYVYGRENINLAIEDFE